VFPRGSGGGSGSRKKSQGKARWGTARSGAEKGDQGRGVKSYPERKTRKRKRKGREGNPYKPSKLKRRKKGAAKGKGACKSGERDKKSLERGFIIKKRNKKSKGKKAPEPHLERDSLPPRGQREEIKR